MTGTATPHAPACGRCGGSGRTVERTEHDPVTGGVQLIRGECGCGGRR